MNKRQFKTIFVANFLSTWCANNYDEFCSTGKHKQLNHPPVEDAEFLAEQAWKELKIHKPS